MKFLWPPIVKLCHLLSVYIICPCDLDLWHIFNKKLDPVTRTQCWRYVPIWRFIVLCVFEIFDHKCRFRVSVAMATILFPVRWGIVLMLAFNSELHSTTQYWVIAFLTGNVTLRCGLDHWPYDIRVMSRDATSVVNPIPSLKFWTAYDLPFHSRTTTIFRWPPA